MFVNDFVYIVGMPSTTSRGFIMNLLDGNLVFFLVIRIPLIDFFVLRRFDLFHLLLSDLHHSSFKRGNAPSEI